MTTKTQHDTLAPSALTQGRAEATLAGQTLADRYDVLELVGVGGMGAVYRARDRELDEIVALKVIRAELSAVPTMVERFRHEVKLARRVTHTNVARTFELGTAGGVMYCTMELVDGEALTKRLQARRVLPVGEAVAIACAVCDGLAAAHARDVIHRDIKPDNILLASDGRVVVADFGVAAAGVSSAGELSGTPVYMAPEQARGEPPTPATDVYAVGIVLYEILTGGPPFTGDLAKIISDKQAVDHVAPASNDVPADLARVIAQATARDRDARLASASVLRRALDPWAQTALRQTAPHRVPQDVGDLVTIVVIAPDASLAEPSIYLAVAAHEELLARLMRLPRVRVLPRVAMEPDEDVIGVCLDVGDGALAVRITHPSGPPTTLTFPLSIDQVVPAAESLAATLGAAVARVRTQLAPAQEANDLLYRARYLMQRDFSRMDEAISSLRRANELAPDEPRIAANLGVALARLAFFRPQGAAESLAQGKQLAQRAIRRAPDVPDVQIAAGHIELISGNPVAAARHFRVAIARAPHLAEAHEQLGRMLLEAGYLDAALARLEDAIAIFPNLRSARWEVARAFALEQRWDEHDRLVADLIKDGVDRPLSRARYAWWRRDWATLDKLRGSITQMDRSLWPGLMEAISGVYLEHKWLENRDKIVAASASDTPNLRRKTFICQLSAETAAFSNDVETAIEMIQAATHHGLFDLHWMDRCELLAPVREHAAWLTLRAPIKSRADSILDALYGDQSAALSETAIA